MNFSEQKSRGRKTRCLPASADTAWNLDQPLLEANTRRVIFLSTTKHAHAAGHVHHHSHHHVVRLSKLHNTTSPFVQNHGFLWKRAQYNAVPRACQPQNPQKRYEIYIRKNERIYSKIRSFAVLYRDRGCTATPRTRDRGSCCRSSRAPFWRAHCFRRYRAPCPPPMSGDLPHRRR